MSKMMIVPDRDKWYHFEVHDSVTDRTRDFLFGELEDIATELHVSAYCDHVPNPQCLALWCERNDVFLYERDMERVMGRWVIEYLDWDSEATLTLTHKPAPIVDLDAVPATGLHLTYNEHKLNYMDLPDWLAGEELDDDDWASPTAREECLASGDLWELRAYPRTPVSFYCFVGPTRLEGYASAVPS